MVHFFYIERKFQFLYFQDITCMNCKHPIHGNRLKSGSKVIKLSVETVFRSQAFYWSVLRPCLIPTNQVLLRSDIGLHSQLYNFGTRLKKTTCRLKNTDQVIKGNTCLPCMIDTGYCQQGKSICCDCKYLYSTIICCTLVKLIFPDIL